MSRFLLLDIGAGTLDILYYDDVTGGHYKAVVKSPVVYLAEQAAQLPGNLLITGNEMGGGEISQVLRERARQVTVLMSASAARTVHHHPDRIRSLGIKIVPDESAEEWRGRGDYSHLQINDLEIERIKRIVAGFGVPFEFEIVGICAQDHGVPPPGVSHLDFRHQIFSDYLNRDPAPESLLFHRNEVPVVLNRLRSIAESSKQLPAPEVYLMDSGMAAILGASMDIRTNGKSRLLVLDVATSHTLGAALKDGAIAGFFEYHTRDITLQRLQALLHELANGTLSHQQILREGGHGAYLCRAIGFDSVETILATGPKRRLLEDSTLPIVLGAPLGDNMLTGAVGILEAIRRRKGLAAINYL